MSCYSNYRGKSLGRLLHYVQKYCGLHYAENVSFSADHTVMFGKEPFATYEWMPTEYDGVMVPKFNFAHSIYNDTQKAKMFEVIGEDVPKELYDRLQRAEKLLGRAGLVSKMDFCQHIHLENDIKEFLKDSK